MHDDLPGCFSIMPFFFIQLSPKDSEGFLSISPPPPLRHQGICYFEVGVIRLMRSGGWDVRKAELTRLRILCLEWRGLVEHLSHKNTNTHLCSCRKHSGDKSQTHSLWLTFKTGTHT